MVEILIEPFVLTEKQFKSETWRTKKQLADQNLKVSKTNLTRLLNHDIPVKFHEPIQLKIRMTRSSLNRRIDYLSIHDPQARKLIKLYITDKRKFASEWLKL